MADLSIRRPFGQGAAIDRQLTHFIGIIYRLKRGSVMAFLPSRLSMAFPLIAELFPVWICGGWLAVEGHVVKQQGYQDEQYFQRRAKRRRKIFLFPEEFFDGVD